MKSNHKLFCLWRRPPKHEDLVETEVAGQQPATKKKPVRKLSGKPSPEAGGDTGGLSHALYTGRWGS